MKIRKAERKDLSDILRIYAYAREFMKEHGNPDQWGMVYPSPELVREVVLCQDLVQVKMRFSSS